MKLEINLQKIKKLAKQRESENLDFRSFLKNTDLSSKEVDEIVHYLTKEVSEQIDCRSCGNCCRELSPIVTISDRKRLAVYVEKSDEEFTKKYTVPDPDQINTFMFNSKPCPFLSDKQCSVYDARPEDCKSYPHLLKKDFQSRLWSVFDNYAVCPIVFNVVEQLKDKIEGYRDFDLSDYL